MSNLKTQEAYLQNSGQCPNTHCNSYNIDGGSVCIDANQAIQEVSCNDCGTVWNDIYSLSGYVLSR